MVVSVEECAGVFLCGKAGGYLISTFAFGNVTHAAEETSHVHTLLSALLTLIKSKLTARSFFFTRFIVVFYICGELGWCVCVQVQSAGQCRLLLLRLVHLDDAHDVETVPEPSGPKLSVPLTA